MVVVFSLLLGEIVNTTQPMKHTLLLILACHALTAAISQSPPGFQWVKTIAFANNASGAEIFDFSTNPQGHSFVYGIFSGSLNFGPGVPILQSQGLSNNYFVAKYAPNGVVEWVRKIFAPNGGTIFVNDTLNPAGISADQFGNVFISGQLSNTALDFGEGVQLQRVCSGDCSDFFVAKYDTAGHVQWVSSGLGSANTYQTATRLVVGTDGSVFVGGNYTGPTLKIGNAAPITGLGSEGIYLSRLLADGQPLTTWFIHDATDYTQLDHLAVTPQNRLLVSGYYTGGELEFGNNIILGMSGSENASNSFLAEFDDQGQAQWAQNINSEIVADILDISADTSGQPYIVVDFSDNLSSGLNEIVPGPTFSDHTAILLHLVDNVFKPVQKIDYNSSFSYPMTNVVVDKFNRYFVSGYFRDVELFVGDSVFQNMNPACEDIVLLSGASGSSPQWVRTAGGNGCEGIFSVYFGRAISTDQFGNLYAVGSYHILQLDNFSRVGDGLFVTKLNTPFVGTHSPETENLDLKVYPNPNAGAFNVEWPDFAEATQFSLYDAQGRICYQKLAAKPSDLEFQLHLPTGLYMLEWLNKKQIGRSKILIAN